MLIELEKDNLAEIISSNDTVIVQYKNKDGQVIEQGAHETLLDNEQGTYKRLTALQQI